MKRTILLGACIVNCLYAEYQSLSSYGQTLYNIIDDFVSTNSTQNSGDVTAFVQSEITQAVFSDAQISGYPKDKVIFETYQRSFVTIPRQDVIIIGLHDLINQGQGWANVQFYGTFVNMGMILSVIVYMVRTAWVYYKHDRPLLDTYRNTFRGTINTTGPFGTPTPGTPLLEPLIQ